MRIPFLCAFLLLSALSTAETYRIVLDGEDPSFSVKSGDWTLDKTGSYLGNYKFSAAGPGTGSSLAVWDIDSIPAGTYDVEFYCDNGNFAADAEYVVEHDAGITTVTRSQNNVGTGWHTLGTYDFTNAGRITQTDYWTGAGTKAIADALRLTLHGEPAPHTENVVPPSITIVVDDLGGVNPATGSGMTAQMFNGAPDLTYAIIPGLTYTNAVLQSATDHGIESILHQPLQYIGQADTNPGDPTRLYVGMTDPQILTALTTNLNNTSPHISGVNNHQGSRFSQYEHGLNLMLGELRSRDLFFYDSRTISDSKSYDLSKDSGMLAAERDLFIDGASTQQTRDLILSLAYRARFAPNYEHLAIGHERANSYLALISAASDLQSTGVALRRLSHNLHYIMETGWLPAGAQVQQSGTWTASERDMISHECHDGAALALTGTSPGSYRFDADLRTEGRYRVFVGFPAGPSNTTQARVTIHSPAVHAQSTLDQSASPNRWHYVGTYSLGSGPGTYIQLDNSLATSPSEVLWADAVKLVYDGAVSASATDWALYE